MIETMEGSSTTNEVLTEEQILQRIAELPANREGVATGVALLGLDNLRKAIETPLHLLPGQHVRTIKSEHDERRLHVGITTDGERSGFHVVNIDKGYEPFPKSVIYLLGKISYCPVHEQTIELSKV